MAEYVLQLSPDSKAIVLKSKKNKVRRFSYVKERPSPVPTISYGQLNPASIPIFGYPMINYSPINKNEFTGKRQADINWGRFSKEII